VRTGFALLGLALLAVAGCGPAAPPAKPVVAATVYPMWEFSRQVAGERAEVIALVPAGVEPHDWEPSPRDVSQVRRAAAFVHSGTGIDAWAERLLADLEGGKTVVVNASRGIALLRAGSATDPHVWLDPTLARVQVLAIAAGLGQADPGGQAAYAANAQAYAARLDALDQAFAAGLRDCARREIVTSHAAYAYLGRRYGLTELSVMGLAPEAEPSPADLAAIVRTARRLKVTHVFFEPLVSARLAQALAREIGATPLPLDPIEGVGRDDSATAAGYVEVMQANLANLRIALGCR
jgi:zinc transport system substrate-binding protein